MLRESLHRWIGYPVTGSVTLRLRRGQDYSVLDTRGPLLSYHPEKLSMERSIDPAFSPDDRIGQLTMRNLDIADSRSKLELYAAHDQLAPVRARQPFAFDEIEISTFGGAPLLREALVARATRGSLLRPPA